MKHNELIDLEWDDLELKTNPDHPFGLSSASSKPIIRGTSCYFCDDEAVVRLREGHPACKFHQKELEFSISRS